MYNCRADEEHPFSIIPVCGDGQCLYRCAAIHCQHALQCCDRGREGIPQSLAEAGKAAAQELHCSVVSLLKTQEQELNALTLPVPFLLDREIGKQYNVCS